MGDPSRAATPRAPLNEYLIEVPHSPEECPAVQGATSNHRDRSSVRRAYCGCGAGTHTTWIIAELAAEEEAWGLVPRLLRDTARIVPVDRLRTNLGFATNAERRST